MTTDVIDDHRFKNQCSLYEPTNRRLTKEAKHFPTAASTKTLYEPSATPSTNNNRRYRTNTLTSVSSNPTNANNTQSRHSSSNDLLSIIRSVAMRPFKTSSTVNTVTEGQSTNVIGGSQVQDKTSVSLLKYRPLSDCVSNQASYGQSTRVCI